MKVKTEFEINTHAETFAVRHNGSIEPYRGLHIVTYKYGSSPSLAYWIGRQRNPVRNIHFLYPSARSFHIERLKEERDNHLRFRLVRKLQHRSQPATA